ncbi:hypothetical protein [Granulicella paludicola]|uniref:hypothetical protein n=1 Tax=Granulicella paludicola TaxID=474951 RepID=UPI0021DF8C49|nr:hypothetical protein [Granulicella paludicola]
MNFANICGHYVNLDAIAYYVARDGGGVNIHFAGGIKELLLPNASIGDVCGAIQKAKTEPDCAAVQTLSDSGRYAKQ